MTTSDGDRGAAVTPREARLRGERDGSGGKHRTSETTARRLVNAPRMLRARVDAKGRITVPKALRAQLGLGPGTQLVLRAEGEELRATTAPALMRKLRGARLRLRRHLAETE